MSISSTGFNPSFDAIQYQLSSPQPLSAWDLINEALKTENLGEGFKENLSPLLICLKLGDCDLFKKLVALGEEIYPENTPFEETTLAIAISNQREDIALFLIEQNFPIHLKGALKGSEGVNFLHLAASRGNVTVCKILIEKGVSPDSTFELTQGKFSRFMSPLMYSILGKHIEVAKFLISLLKPEDLNQEVDRKKNTFLHVTIPFNDLETYKLLLESGANPNLPNNEGRTPIYDAIYIKSPKFCELLLKYGADLNMRDKDLNTPLHAVTFVCDLEICQRLLESGANPNLQNKDLETPIYNAIYLKSQPLCELLLAHGADLNVRDKDLNTPLHTAAYSKVNEQFIDYLLAKGADARALNKNGEPILHVLFSSFTPKESYALLIEKDQGLSAVYRTLSLFGNRFSLKGPLFEGSHLSFTFYEAARSLQQFIGNPVDQLLLEIPYLFAEASQQIGNVDYFMERIENGKITVIPTGWSGHGTSLVVYKHLDKHFFCRNNSGEHSGEKPGITIFEMEEPKNLRSVLAELLQENRPLSIQSVAEFYSKKEKIKSDKIDLFNNRIISSLKLKEVYYLRKSQRAGNCAWLAAKMAAKCTFIFKHKQKNPEHDIQDCIIQSKPLYNGWVKLDSLNAIPFIPAITAVKDFHPFYNVDQVWHGVFRWLSRTRKMTNEDLGMYK